MAYPKRKAQHDVAERDAKKTRQSSPTACRQTYAGEQQSKRGGRVMTQQPHTREQIFAQLHHLPQHIAAQMKPQFPVQQHNLLQIAQQKEDESEEEQEEHQPTPFSPYSELKIPVLCSVNIDHGFSPVVHKEKLDSTALKHYYHAVAMAKTGLSREHLGLPPAKSGYGTPITIDDVDLYLDLGDGKIYVAASERGLMTVADYLDLSGIAMERKLCFTGRTPGWAKSVFGDAEKRYVTELWEALHGTPVPVRSEIYVLDTFEMPIAPTGMWGNMYSAHFKKVVQFPLAYTTTDREFAMVKGNSCSLSAAELKQVLAVQAKEPTPEELGEALFAQAKECDRGELDLQMTKSRDDYLKECGYLYAKHAPAEAQEKKGIFFESPPFAP